MTRTIDFPHLGIHLSSVGNHITVFGFDIAYYGMIIGAGILAGIFMAVYEAKRTGQKEEDLCSNHFNHRCQGILRDFFMGYVQR